MARQTAIKAIREFCKQCTCGDIEAIRECKPVPGIEACALWRFRMGKNPNISEESKQARREAALARGFGAKTVTEHKEA